MRFKKTLLLFFYFMIFTFIQNNLLISEEKEKIDDDLLFELSSQDENKTLEEIKSNCKIDNNIVRFLIVKSKNLDLKTEYFNKTKAS